jgi:hypothetical protein
MVTEVDLLMLLKKGQNANTDIIIHAYNYTQKILEETKGGEKKKRMIVSG